MRETVSGRTRVVGGHAGADLVSPGHQVPPGWGRVQGLALPVQPTERSAATACKGTSASGGRQCLITRTSRLQIRNPKGASKWVFDDMKEALRTYPETDVALEIVDVFIGGEEALNVNETGGFRVKVTNNGPLDLKDVTVRVKGLNGMTVSDNVPNAELEEEFVTATAFPLIEANGGSALTSPRLGFKAPSEPSEDGESLDLIKAWLEQWNASLNHIPVDQSGPLQTVKAIYASEVLPD